MISMPRKVRHAVVNRLKPSIGRVRRLMNRWSCSMILAGLDEQVNQVTVLVHGAPQILALTVDRDEDFVQQPRISESTLTSLHPPGRNRGRTSRTIAE